MAFFTTMLTQRPIRSGIFPASHSPIKATNRYFGHRNTSTYAPSRTTQPNHLLSCRALPLSHELPPDTLAAFETCCSALQDQLGLTPGESETVLIKAFALGPKRSPYWRDEKDKVTPDLNQIDEALEFLDQKIGISSPIDQAQIVRLFPEVLGLSTDLMQSNVDQLQSRFFLKGAALAGAVKRKPRALGCIVDCEGSCEGLCTRCFAQF
jgi:hypothetical protein